MTTTVRGAIALLVAGACLTAWLPSQAGAPKKKTAEKLPEEYRAGMVDDLITARRLEEFGRKYKAPEALITAGDLLRKLATISITPLSEDKDAPKTVEVEDENGVKKEEPIKGEKGPNLNDEAEALFIAAEAMAAKLNLNLTKQLKLARERDYKAEEEFGERAVVGGPKSFHRTIGPRATQTIHVTFWTGRPAAVGFASSMPLHVHAVRQGTDHIWMSGVTMHAVHHGVPAGPFNGKAKVTFRVHNPHKKTGNYQLFLN